MNSNIHLEVTLAAAHIVHTDKKSPCYRLHGHNWRLEIFITGQVKEDGMIIDFKDVKEFLKEYDHKFWFPDHESVKDEKLGDLINLPFENKDFVYIPVPVITCEHMAQYFAEQIYKLQECLIRNITVVEVKLYESETSYAIGIFYEHVEPQGD